MHIYWFKGLCWAAETSKCIFVCWVHIYWFEGLCWAAETSKCIFVCWVHIYWFKGLCVKSLKCLPNPQKSNLLYLMHIHHCKDWLIPQKVIGACQNVNDSLSVCPSTCILLWNPLLILNPVVCFESKICLFNHVIDNWKYLFLYIYLALAFSGNFRKDYQLFKFCPLLSSSALHVFNCHL